jgi:hypothetical protein
MEMNEEKFLFYITKYWKTGGILKRYCQIHKDKYAHCKYGYENESHKIGLEAFRTKEEAIARISYLLQEEIAKTEKQLEELKLTNPIEIKINEKGKYENVDATE